MTDMLKVIEPKSDQINAEDLIGRDMTITVKAVTVRAGTEQPVSIEFNGSEKVFRPCKTVSRILVAAWGPDTSVYPGRSLTLYRDAKVKWGGMEVGGIRVRAMSHIDAPLKLALAESKNNRTITVVQPLKIEVARVEEPKTRQTAEEWAAVHIAFVVGAADLDRLAAVQNAGKKAMEKLATGNPELHQRVTDAYAARFAELSDDPFLTPDNPAVTEGPFDEDRGEYHTDPRAETVASIIADLNIAACAADIKAADKLFVQHRAAMSDDQVAAIEAAARAAKMRVGGQGQ